MQFIKSVKIDPKILESKIKRTNFRKQFEHNPIGNTSIKINQTGSCDLISYQNLLKQIIFFFDFKLIVEIRKKIE